MRKIRLVTGSARTRRVKMTPPSPEVLLMVAQPTCPHCYCVFFVDWQKIDFDTHIVTVEHSNGEFYTCPSRGKRFQFKIPSVVVTEVA